MAHFRLAEQEPLIGGGYPQYTGQPQPTGGQAYQHGSHPNKPKNKKKRKPAPPIPTLYTEQTTSFDSQSLVNGLPPPDPPMSIPSSATYLTSTVYASTTPIPVNVQTHFPSIVKWCILLGVLLIWPAWPFALVAFGFALHSRYLARNGALYYERAQSLGQRARYCCMLSLAIAIVYVIIAVISSLSYFFFWVYVNIPPSVPFNSTISPYLGDSRNFSKP